MASGISLATLRGDDQVGFDGLIFLFAVVWTTDILAYFVGRAVGGPKLAPAISPGKTWSGAVGGAAGGLAAGLAVGAAFGGGTILLLGLVALVLSAVSQGGDLFESWVKRRHGVKDFEPAHPRARRGHGSGRRLVAAAFALLVIGWLGGAAERPASLFFPG